MKQSIGYIGLGLFFLFIFLFALKEPALVLPPEKEEGLPDYAFEKIHVLTFDNNELSWEIYADYAEIDEEADMFSMKTVDGFFYNDDQPIVDLTAVSANVRLSGSDMMLYNAKAFFRLSDKTITLETNSLLWDDKISQFRGEGDVQIQSDQIQMSGDRFQVEVPVRKMVISNHGQVLIKSGGLK